jgi:hypothetical protein
VGILLHGVLVNTRSARSARKICLALAGSTLLVLILSGRVVVRTMQDRPPDHDHPAVGLPGARELAVKPFTTLPKGVLFLRL